MTLTTNLEIESHQYNNDLANNISTVRFISITKTISFSNSGLVGISAAKPL